MSPATPPPPDETEALITRVNGAPARRRLRSWLISIASAAAFTVLIGALGYSGLLEKSPWLFLLAILLVVGPALLIAVLAERAEARSVEELVACKDIRALSGLLDSINCGNRRVRRAIRDTLLQFLPLLTEEHSVLLDTRHREALNALLFGDSGDLTMATLGALERLGDGTALPYVTSMAAGRGVPATLRNRRQEAQEAAHRTLKAIHARIDAHNRPMVLLRASETPGTPSEQLVRPAHSVTHADANDLLRPHAQTEAGPDEKEKRS